MRRRILEIRQKFHEQCLVQPADKGAIAFVEAQIAKELASLVDEQFKRFEDYLTKNGKSTEHLPIT
jgi:hypothetical protein